VRSRTREGGGISRDQGDPTKLETLVSRSLVEQEQQQTFNSDFEGNVQQRFALGQINAKRFHRLRTSVTLLGQDIGNTCCFSSWFDFVICEQWCARSPVLKLPRSTSWSPSTARGGERHARDQEGGSTPNNIMNLGKILRV
jgi:hypothetical protein